LFTQDKSGLRQALIAAQAANKKLLAEARTVQVSLTTTTKILVESSSWKVAPVIPKAARLLKPLLAQAMVNWEDAAGDEKRLLAMPQP
jgi:hypothetical protein